MSAYIEGLLGGGSDPVLSGISGLMLRKDLFDMAGRKLFAGGLENLQEKDLRLAIAQKKRAMGLPLDDDDYQDAVNRNLSLPTKVAGSMGLEHIRAKIDEPVGIPARLLNPTIDIMKTKAKVPAMFGSFKESPMYGIPKVPIISEDIRSMFNATKGALSHVPRPVKRGAALTAILGLISKR